MIFLTTNNIRKLIYDYLLNYSEQVRDFNSTFDNVDISRTLIKYRISSVSDKSLSSFVYNLSEVLIKNVIITIQVVDDNIYSLADDIINSLQSENVLKSFNDEGLGITSLQNINFLSDDYNAKVVRPLVQFDLYGNYYSEISNYDEISNLKLIINNKEVV